MIPCQLIHKYSPLLTDHIFAFVCKMWLYPPGQMCRSLSHLRILTPYYMAPYPIVPYHMVPYHIKQFVRITILLGSRLCQLEGRSDYPVIRSRVSLNCENEHEIQIRNRVQNWTDPVMCKEFASPRIPWTNSNPNVRFNPIWLI